ncbi:LD-carboxypeptidase [Sporosarcina gallistercoris]|uniref:S66 peptidase family protein n=1 Tax=Sporosarcina gallistercoris TaxID=2762245 RepID=UPI003D276255
MKLVPKRLKAGDTIGIVAPASPPDQESLTRSFAFLESMGLKWKIGKHVKDLNGYLAGTDDDRLSDLEEMFADPEIAGIICAGGGYGSARFADRLDYQLIQENPKVFWGFSDITFLHTAIANYTDLVTFHGPMLASCVGKETFHELSAKMFRQLFEPMELHYSEAISPLETLSAGVVSGELTGGNLSLLASGIGTKFEVNTKDKLLLIEDVGEEPYRVDNLLNQLRLAGKFSDAAGIVIGDFAKAEPKKETSLTLDEVLRHYTADLGKPVVSGFKIGHCEPHFAIPFGTKARLDADQKTLTILPGVE